MAKVMMCDPPSGWKYGFPKPIPKEVGEDIRPWLLSEGYPSLRSMRMVNTFMFGIGNRRLMKIPV